MAAPPSAVSDAIRTRAWDQLWSLLLRPVEESPAPPPAPTDQRDDADEAAAA